MADDSKATIKELIQIELAAASDILDGSSELPILEVVHERLLCLLKRLESGQVLPEYAEVELEAIQELESTWRDNMPELPE